VQPQHEVTLKGDVDVVAATSLRRRPRDLIVRGIDLERPVRICGERDDETHLFVRGAALKPAKPRLIDFMVEVAGKSTHT